MFGSRSGRTDRAQQGAYVLTESQIYSHPALPLSTYYCSLAPIHLGMVSPWQSNGTKAFVFTGCLLQFYGYNCYQQTALVKNNCLNLTIHLIVTCEINCCVVLGTLWWMQSNKHWVEEQDPIQLLCQQWPRLLPHRPPSPPPMHPPLDRARLQEPGKGMLEWISGVAPTVPWETVQRICACALKNVTSSKCKLTLSRGEERLIKRWSLRKLNVKRYVTYDWVWCVFVHPLIKYSSMPH